MSEILESENTAYNFESQLELGELLLNLGRSREAIVELKKAQELCDLGAIENPVESTEHKNNLERLRSGLERAGKLDSAVVRRSTLMWILLSVLLALGAGAAILMLVFNRADLARANIQITQVAVTVADSNRVLELSQMENTRTVKEIVNQSNLIGTVSADNTRIAEIALARDDLIQAEEDRLESQIKLTEAAATLVMLRDALATATYIPPNEKLQQVLVNKSSVNLRQGPGTNYTVRRYVYDGDILDVIAINEDGNWYNVRTSRGVYGWVARSVVLPIAFEDVKVAATIPAAPSTSTPVPEADLTARADLEAAETESAELTATAEAEPTETPTPEPITETPEPTVEIIEEAGDDASTGENGDTEERLPERPTAEPETDNG